MDRLIDGGMDSIVSNCNTNNCSTIIYPSSLKKIILCVMRVCHYISKNQHYFPFALVFEDKLWWTSKCRLAFHLEFPSCRLKHRCWEYRVLQVHPWEQAEPLWVMSDKTCPSCLNNIEQHTRQVSENKYSSQGRVKR